jgi:hypothetical protein
MIRASLASLEDASIKKAKPAGRTPKTGAADVKPKAKSRVPAGAAAPALDGRPWEPSC